VLVTLEYRIDPANKQEFLAAMQELGRLRRRDGAVDWGLYHDVSDPGSFLEVFIAESWVEHLRQHKRITVADMELQAKARAYQLGEAVPGVRHFISAYNDGASTDYEKYE
jgi:quinol monooxygenase YgiN